MRRVVWTDESVANLDRIAAYIDAFNPTAARRMAIRLRSAAESLSEYPDRGREVRRGVRELTVIYPYLIRYRVVGDTVIILRVRHGARRPD